MSVKTKMTVAIHQPNYFPYYGYFHKIKSSDIFVFLDNVKFSTESFTNRNQIKTSAGVKWLTVPIVRKDISKTVIKDVKISNVENWCKSHLEIIYDSYRDSKHFQSYKNVIKSVYDKRWDNLCELNIYITERLCKVLDINTKFIRASSLNVSEKKAGLICEICEELGADIYFSGISGRNYNDEQRFKEHDIEVIYQSFEHPIYQQLHGNFIENLSILDIFFNMRIGDYL